MLAGQKQDRFDSVSMIHPMLPLCSYWVIHSSANDTLKMQTETRKHVI